MRKRLSHDANDRLTSITLPDPDGVGSQTSPVTEFTYDTTTGLMTEIEDALDNTITFEYDFAGRLKKKTFDDLTTNLNLTGHRAGAGGPELGMALRQTPPTCLHRRMPWARSPTPE